MAIRIVNRPVQGRFLEMTIDNLPKTPAVNAEPTKLKRAKYLSGKTAAAQKPWETEGMSRRTWYRRQAQKRAAP